MFLTCVPIVQRPRTPAFHAGNAGSNPAGDAHRSLCERERPTAVLRRSALALRARPSGTNPAGDATSSRPPAICCNQLNPNEVRTVPNAPSAHVNPLGNTACCNWQRSATSAVVQTPARFDSRCSENASSPSTSSSSRRASFRFNFSDGQPFPQLRSLLHIRALIDTTLEENSFIIL